MQLNIIPEIKINLFIVMGENIQKLRYFPLTFIKKLFVDITDCGSYRYR